MSGDIYVIGASHIGLADGNEKPIVAWLDRLVALKPRALYLNGDPGQIDALGKADILPNYFQLFMPKSIGNPEALLVFTHGGTGTTQGEELMRDFAGRSHEGSQCWVSPRYEIADRYQSLTTGDFVAPLIPMNPTVPATGNVARTTPGSAVNPQSYANRDYRMK